jgi:uncharacterized Tic20 family protein
MDENMENQNPTPEEQPQQPPQPETPPPPPPGVGGPTTPPPPPTEMETDKDAKMWGMFCHLAALITYLGVPFGNILGPLIIWLIKKDEMVFVNDQGKEALNFQITVTIASLAIFPTLCFPPLFVLLLLAIGIADLVFIIIASIESNKGKAYRYPFSIRMIK